MKLVLLERVEKLGKIGDIVTVKPGFGRNFLLPRNKALRATPANLEQFEKMKAQIEKENAEKVKAAQKNAKLVENISVVIIRQAGDDGRLYGSVTTRDIAKAISEKSEVEVKHNDIVVDTKFKTIGIYTVKITLHPEVVVQAHVNISRSEEEAKAAMAEFLKPASKKEEEKKSSEEAPTAEKQKTANENAEIPAEEEAKADKAE
jgi:large subunit ribosomal protein L9